MKIDPKLLIAANDNYPKPREAAQLALPLELPPGNDARLESATSVAAADGKAAKPSRRRSKPAAKPAPTRVPAAVSGTDPDPAPAPPLAPGPDAASAAPPPDVPDAEVISFKAERIAREPRIVQLNQMLDQTYILNQSCLKLVQIGGETPQEEDSYFRNWGLSTATFTRLLNTLHKHYGFLDNEA